MQSQSQPSLTTPTLPNQNALIAKLRHLFKLSILETFTTIPPHQAAQYFEPPFNTSPYFEIIITTITNFLHEAQKTSMMEFDQLVHNEIQLEDRFIVLERLITNELLSQSGENNSLQQTKVLTADWDEYVKLSEKKNNNNKKIDKLDGKTKNKAVNNNNDQPPALPPPRPPHSKSIDLSVTIHAKKLAILKQQEQLLKLQELLQDIESENAILASQLTKRNKGSEKLIQLFDSLATQTQQFPDKINTVVGLMNSEP